MAATCLSGLADYITRHGKQSCRKLAEKLGVSKSSVNRRQKKIDKRSDILASDFFETQEGQRFITRLVVACIFVFGITSGVGANRISHFMSLIQIDQFKAVSPSSISRTEDQIDDLIVQFKERYDAELKKKAGQIDITPGGDETFFDNLMLLVLMDLTSGFIFVEQAAEKRDHATWESCTLPLLSHFNIVRCFLSDKAKALLKLAKDSLKTDRIPDLFHMMRDVSLVMRYAFMQKKKSNDSSIAAAQKQIVKEDNIHENKAILANLESQQQTLLADQQTYKLRLRSLSTLLHPLTLASCQPQSSSDTEGNMLSCLSDIRQIKERHNISDKKNRLDRVERQIPDAAKQIDLWWTWVNTSLDCESLASQEKEWLISCLLPFVYWKRQIKKTSSKSIKQSYSNARDVSETKLLMHPLTDLMLPEGITKQSTWLTWAAQMTNMFIRTTSAIEGRNSWLTQLHFNGRGLSEKRLKSQTAIHNYHLKRADDTTAYERLTGDITDDMFEYIILNVQSLGEPRKRKARAVVM